MPSGPPHPRPLLIIAGGASADEPVAARWFQAASPVAVQVRVVPHAGHTQGRATAPRAWEAHVISFLNTAMLILGPVIAPGESVARQAARPAARSPRPGQVPPRSGRHRVAAAAAPR